MGMWGNDKPDQKRYAGTGVGWLRSPQNLKVVKIAPADITAHAQWVTVTDGDVLDSSRVLVRRHRRMLRFNAETLAGLGAQAEIACALPISRSPFCWPLNDLPRITLR